MIMTRVLAQGVLARGLLHAPLSLSDLQAKRRRTLDFSLLFACPMRAIVVNNYQFQAIRDDSYEKMG